MGNTLRGDDGAGHWVCDAIEKAGLTGVTTLKVHQLQTELIQEMAEYDKIVIVDAAVGVSDVSIQKVEAIASGMASSHHTDTGILKLLARQLYKKDLDIHTCAIPAKDFSHSEQISGDTKSFADVAVKAIEDWINL